MGSGVRGRHPPSGVGPRWRRTRLGAVSGWGSEKETQSPGAASRGLYPCYGAISGDSANYRCQYSRVGRTSFHSPQFPLKLESLGPEATSESFPGFSRILKPIVLSPPGPAYAMYPYYNPPEALGPPSTSPLTATSPQNKRTHMSTPGESPGSSASKVPKVSRACDYCKSKKTKCSGTRPCGSCVKRGITCHYDAKYSRGRPPTPPAGPSSADGGRDTAVRRGVEFG